MESDILDDTAKNRSDKYSAGWRIKSDQVAPPDVLRMTWYVSSMGVGSVVRFGETSGDRVVKEM